MSNRLSTLVWGAKPFGSSRTGLSMRLVMASLADQVNDARDVDFCYPKLKSIEERTEMGRRTVQRALNELKVGGWIQVTEKPGYGSKYTLNIRRLEEHQRPTRERGLYGTRASMAPVPSKHGRGALNADEGCLERLPNKEEPEVNQKKKQKAVAQVENALAFDPEYQLTPLPRPKLVKSGTPAENSKEASFTLPDWIPADLWRDHITICSRPGKTMKKETLDAKVRKLEKLRRDGNDPAEVIDRSNERGWAGFFEIPLNERAPRMQSTELVPQLSTAEKARLQRQ